MTPFAGVTRWPADRVVERRYGGDMGVSLLAPSISLLGHHPLGASTGYMRGWRGDWAALVREATVIAPYAIELSVLDEDELPGLVRYLSDGPELPFRYVSVHGPSKGRRMGEPELCGLLAGLEAAHAVVVHPDTIEDPDAYGVLGERLVLENMDARKNDGRGADELERWFELLPLAGFCFDIAHAWSLDPTMALGEELLDAFAPRVRHVHVSSMDAQLHHTPLRFEDEERFAPLLERCRDVPWILEAPPRDC
jgi:hypothetical protein